MRDTREPQVTSATTVSIRDEPSGLGLPTSADEILLVDCEGTILFTHASRTSQSTAGTPGMSLFSALPPGWRPRIQQSLARARATATEQPFQLAEGTTRTEGPITEGCVFPLTGANEQKFLITFSATTPDGQERDQLREQAERYRFLTDTISDVIWTMDLDQRITYVSPSIHPLTGYGIDEMESMELRDLLAPESFALAREILLEELRLEYQADLESSPSRTLDLKLMRKDGSTLWCEAKMSFLRDSHGRPIGVLGVARDISSWREAQEALVASEEKLRRAQRLEAVGQLAGGVAHDFNNLLTVVIGNVELMLNQLQPEDPQRDQAEEISKAAERAAVLTRQLLAFSRRQMMMPEVLDLNGVVERMATMLRGLVGESIELHLDLYPALDQVEIDPSQIELALVNLALNARDAMVEGGRLVIETANTRLASDAGNGDFDVNAGPYVLLAVTDSGKGIDPADQARIFEPFFTTKQVGKGTGLGLSTVDGIVKQRGGYIWVNSRPGQGSRFEIYLPRVERVPLEPDKASQGATSTLPQTILLVEDEMSVRTLTRRILQDHGYHVLDVDRGAQALDVLRDRDQRVDLLLSDVVMPGMSGTQLARRAVEIRPELRVLYMSGHSEDMLDRLGDIDLTSPLLQKPFSTADLTSMVRETLTDRSCPGAAKQTGS